MECLYRDNPDEKRASIKMRVDCRGGMFVAVLIVAGNGYFAG
jgi:hypothetical protein